MSFKAGNVEIGKADLRLGPPTLSQEQLIFLLKFIKTSDFKGGDMEEIYKVTLKLQEMYLYWDKKNQMTK